jgi:hypothetical protein
VTAGGDDDGDGRPSTAVAGSERRGAEVADVAKRYQLPISHEVSLRGHSKVRRGACRGACRGAFWCLSLLTPLPLRCSRWRLAWADYHDDCV